MANNMPTAIAKFQVPTVDAQNGVTGTVVLQAAISVIPAHVEAFFTGLRDEIAAKYDDIASWYPDISGWYPTIAFRYTDILTRHGDVADKAQQVEDMHVDIEIRHEDTVAKHATVSLRFNDISSMYNDVSTWHPEVVYDHLDVKTRHGDIVDKHAEVIDASLEAQLARDAAIAAASAVGDPLAKAQNLADVPDKAVGRTNLGVYSTGEVNAALGDKSDVGHGHVIADVTGLQNALDGKSATSHSHSIANVTGLQTALDGKVSKAQNLADVLDKAVGRTNLDVYSTGEVNAALADKSDIGHGHAIADVTGLQNALDGKSATSHSHSIANVTGLQNALDGKAGASELDNYLAKAEFDPAAPTLVWEGSSTSVAMTSLSEQGPGLYYILGGSSIHLVNVINTTYTHTGSCIASKNTSYTMIDYATFVGGAFRTEKLQTTIATGEWVIYAPHYEITKIWKV